MRTMYRVNKGPYQCFTLDRADAEIARRTYSQLKGGRIKHILQANPSQVKLCALYKFEDVVNGATKD